MRLRRRPRASQPARHGSFGNPPSHRPTRRLAVLLLASSLSFAVCPAAAVDVSLLVANDGGVVINGADTENYLGSTVTTIGDINGDGLDDVLINTAPVSAPPSQPQRAYVIYGRRDSTTIELGGLGNAGFAIEGLDAGDAGGASIAPAGDFNGDGFADFALGASTSDLGGDDSGAVYIVFGASGLPGVNIGTLVNDNRGNVFPGQVAGGRFGHRVAPAGDFDGDGKDDIIVSSARPGGDPDAPPRLYIVRGGIDDSGISTRQTINRGFVITGEDSGGEAAAVTSIASAGDVNGDGRSDVIIGVPTHPDDQTRRGRSYVVFGRTSGDFEYEPIDLADVALGIGGFVMDGEEALDEAGTSVSAAGDVNGDGFGDVIVGAPLAGQPGSDPGKAYVIHGKSDTNPVSLADVAAGSGGFVILGKEGGTGAGISVAGGGDLDRDGLCDLLVGSVDVDGSDPVEGRVFVIRGRQATTPVDLASPGADGYEISPEAETGLFGRFFSPAGDFNGDGRIDLVLAAPAKDLGNGRLGRVYIVHSTGDHGPDHLYKGFDFFGSVPLRAVAPYGKGDRFSGSARASLGFNSGGGPAPGSASLHSVELFHDADAISGLDEVAGIYWQITTNRTNWSQTTVSFVYTDEEIAGLDEEKLFLYRAASPSGPWNPVINYTLDTARNTLTGTTSGLGFFALSNQQALLPVNLADVAMGIGGYVINGESSGDLAGESLSAAGDVNGDGLADLVLGAAASDANGFDSGRAYVVFGKSATGKVELSAVSGGAGGFAINGENFLFEAGASVSAAGDMNADGFEDVVIGSPSAATTLSFSGRSYVVHGKDDGEPVYLADIVAGDGGFPIDGELVSSYSGYCVSSAGDVNRDGIGDLVIGAPEATGPNGNRAGRIYVVFGREDAMPTPLADVANGTGGFVIDGENAGDGAGTVACGVDVNGDNYSDILIGVPNASAVTPTNAGRIYVVFGKDTTEAVDLRGVASGAGGFIIDGAAGGDLAGSAVAPAGDVNSDGMADFIIGAPEADTQFVNAGKAYVIHGSASPEQFDLADIEAGSERGFAIRGEGLRHQAGQAVSTAGDVNGDGLSDVIIGARRANTNRGRSYVVFGQIEPGTVDLALVAQGVGGFAISGSAVGEYAGTAVSTAGDVNGDGLDDLLIGAPQADPNGADSGRIYVVFSPAPPRRILPRPTPHSIRYTGVQRAGFAPRRGIGLTGDGDFAPGSARISIGFDNGTTSMERIDLLTGRRVVRGFNPDRTAAVSWHVLSTTRTNYNQASVAFEYTFAEVLGIDEAKLALYYSPDGMPPLVRLRDDFLRDAARNQVSITTDQLPGYYLLIEEPPAADLVMGVLIGMMPPAGDSDVDGDNVVDAADLILSQSQ